MVRAWRAQAAGGPGRAGALPGLMPGRVGSRIQISARARCVCVRRGLGGGRARARCRARARARGRGLWGGAGDWHLGIYSAARARAGDEALPGAAAGGGGGLAMAAAGLAGGGRAAAGGWLAAGWRGAGGRAQRRRLRCSGSAGAMVVRAGKRRR